MEHRMSFHTTLQEKIFVPVPIPISYGNLEEAAKLYLKFLENVPDKVKRALCSPKKFDHGTDDGYTCKTREKGDPKEYFHWNHIIRKTDEYWKCRRTYESAFHFFVVAETIYNQIESVAYELFKREFPDHVDNAFVNEKMVNGSLRFLSYTPDDTVTFQAAGHYDKGPGTFALYESSPGLRIGCCNNHPMTKVVHEPGTALFMPGELLFEDSKGTIPKAWHDVIPNPAARPVSKRCQRLAIVFFVNDKDGRYPSKETTHTAICSRRTA